MLTPMNAYGSSMPFILAQRNNPDSAPDHFTLRFRNDGYAVPHGLSA
jgi:hypothetical protein